MIICLLIILVVVLSAVSWWAAPLYYNKRMRKKIERAKHQWAFTVIPVNEMRRLLQRYEPCQWITADEEQSFYEELTDPVALFRGGSMLEQQTEYGSSWSISREVAEFHAFACAKEQRAVFVTIVPKSAIRAILLARDEAECLLLAPANVRVLTTKPTSLFDKYRVMSQMYKEMYDETMKTLHNLNTV